MKSNQMKEIKGKSPSSWSWRFSVAPMMEWADRHCRFFHRLLTRRALLYTEMLTTGAVLHGDRARLLRFDAAEHPLALRLGGSEPRALAACARIGADLGFDEINLNAGCPSDSCVAYVPATPMRQDTRLRVRARPDQGASRNPGDVHQ
jgi:tRNA-dihydrouridine synthase A